MALFLIVIGVIWFAQGGPKKLNSNMSLFLRGPQVSSSPEFSNSGAAQQNNSQQNQANAPSGASLLLNESKYKSKAVLRVYNVLETDPKKEYVEIAAAYSNTESLPITGWTLEGRQGLKLTIGQGAYLIYSAQVNPQNSIYLEPNGIAVIATGQSPVGTNFRLNMCAGYFNQFQQFSPYVPESCSYIDAKDVPQNYPEACYDFVRTLQRCRMPTSVPPAVGNDCIQFISERANYNGCVNFHKNDKDFYGKEWRIYLGRASELWQKRDTIILRDQEGKIIDQVSYSY